jgi:hypothetical protein
MNPGAWHGGQNEIYRDILVYKRTIYNLSKIPVQLWPVPKINTNTA